MSATLVDKTVERNEALDELSLPESRKVPGVRRIAVLRSNSLGDYVFAVPALEALRRAYPQAEIVFLGQHWHRRFLAGRPGPVNRVAVVPYLKGIHPGPGGRESASEEVEAFFSQMHEERFDIALQLHGGGRHSNPFVRRLGAGLSAGLKTPDAERLDRWIPYIYYHPEVLRYLEAVALVGANPVTLEPRVIVTRRDLDEARECLGSEDGALAVLHPGATDTRRRWPAERFGRVGDALADLGASVVVTGSPDELKITEEVTRSMRAPARNLCGRLSLNGLAGLLSLSGIVVSNDTGPLHLARAVGAPTVGIYWAGNLINAGPLTVHKHRTHLSWRLECPVCGKDCTKHECPHRDSFVADVNAEEVIESSRELFTRHCSGSRSAGAVRDLLAGVAAGTIQPDERV